MTEEKAEWHWLQGKEQSGPHPLSKVLEAIAQGVVNRTSYVWRQGWPEWKPAGSVPELFTGATAPPAAPTVAASAGAAPAGSAAAEPSTTDQTHYVVRHWRGDLSLPMSFWVNGILVSIGLQILSAPVAAVSEPISKWFEDGGNIVQFVAALCVATFMVALGLAVMVWQCVGIWRSASKHSSRGGNVFWAFLAKLMTIVWVMTLLVGVVSVAVLALIALQGSA